MTFRPKKLKRAKMGLRESPWLRCEPHLAYIRSLECCIKGELDHVCKGKTEPMHVRIGTDGGGSVKPSDNFTIPGCSAAHREQHQHGERTFAAKYKIVLLDIAAKCEAASPALKRYRAKQLMAGVR